MNIQ
jgi:hypothetical protein